MFLKFLLLTACLAITNAHAQSEALLEFDIARAPLGSALAQLRRQTEPPLAFSYFTASAQDPQPLVGPLKGRYSTGEALTRLLSPAGLAFEWVGPHRIRVFAAERTSPATSEQDRDDAQSAPASRSPAPGTGAREIARVIVRAGRLPLEEDSASPVRSYDRKHLARSGATTVAEFLKEVTEQPYTHTEGFRASGAQFADLRGLGPDLTLVLINGRRTFASASSITSNAFDLNTIPITAIDRIEVLLDAASARYGSDATGGVINIVLRREVPASLELHYREAQGGAEQHRAAASLGARGERMQGALVLDYLDLGGLLGKARSRWSDQDFRRFGGADLRSINASPGNLTALGPSNLPGLSARSAAVPSGPPLATVSIADFVPGAGHRNLESLFRYVSLVPEASRFSAVGTGEWRLAPQLTLVGEALYVDRRASFQFPPPLLPGVLVPASNAFNPFGVPVIANTLLTGLAPQEQHVDARLHREVLGLRAPLGDWQLELTALHSEEEAEAHLARALDFARVGAALAQSDPARALNVFQDAGGGSDAALASILADRKLDRLASSGTQGALSAAGALPLPWPGAIDTFTHAEWRRERAQFDAIVGPRERTVRAAALELQVPLLPPAALPSSGSEQDISGARTHASARAQPAQALTLTLAGRLDEYSDFGRIATPQIGLLWRPNASWRARASWGESFRAPSLYELYVPKISVPFQFPDPRRDGELAAFTLLSGGNPDLAPTRGCSITLGASFTPQHVPGLEVSATLWRLEVRDRVTPLSPVAALANEGAFADRVTRSAPTEADRAAGRPGSLRSLDISRVNAGRLGTSGIDLTARYTIDRPGGRLTPRAAITWIDSFETADLPGTPRTERVNVASFTGTIVRWRLLAALDWQRERTGLSLTARYTPPYEDAVADRRTGRRIGSQLLLDAQATFDIDAPLRSPLGGVRVSLGATNVFDRHAPFAEVASAAGFDQSQGDLTGRSWYLRVSKTF